MRPGVFLDRDGVLIREMHYLSRPRQVRLLVGVADALVRLRKEGFKLVVISNQSGIARGYMSRQDVRAVHRRLRHLLSAAGARLDAIYYCPHYPQSKIARYRRVCLCRKPSTGMVRMAVRRLKIDIKKSFLVGDKTSDILTARRAGCRAILVKTGYGGRDGEYLVQPHKVSDNLAAAAHWILRQS